MSDTTQVTERGKNAVAPQKSNEQRRRDPRSPTVDIIEDAHSVTLWAALPGVSKGKLDVKIQDGRLTIDAEAVVPVPTNLRLIHVEVKAPRFSRSFTASDDFDTSKIDASLKDGVLRLTLSRREEAKPRRVQITANWKRVASVRVGRGRSAAPASHAASVRSAVPCWPDETLTEAKLGGGIGLRSR
jgi:HSP20 family molecular chaperone IbpA